MRKKFLPISILFYFTALSSFATDYYWIGNGGQWKDASHWATSSGGASAGVVPTIDDNVFFDANSFTLPGQVVQVLDDSTLIGVDFHTMDWRGVTNTPTFRIRATLVDWISQNVTGSIYFDDNMIIDFQGAEFYFMSTSNYELDTRGHYMGFNCWLAFNVDYVNGFGANVTCTLLSDINHAWIYVAQGTLNANGNTIDSQKDGTAYTDIWLAGNPNPAILNISNTDITIGRMDIQNASSVIDDNATITVERQISAVGQNFNHVIVADTVNIVGAAGNTFNTLELLPGSGMNTNGTHTVTNLIANGTAAFPIFISGGSITKATGVVSTYGLSINNNNALGGATFNTYGSTKLGTTSGWRFYTVGPTDSLALVALYNSTAGPSWTNRGKWLQEKTNAWLGVTAAAGRVTELSLNNNNLSGPLPAQLSNLTELTSLQLDDNNLTDLPDLTALGLTTLHVKGNNFTFTELEPYVGIPGFVFAPQDQNFGTDSETLVEVFDNYTVTAEGGGASGQYQWKRNGVVIEGATEKDFEIVAIDRESMGDYTADITNSALPGITLTTAVKRVLATADISGSLLTNAEVPVTAGKMRLLKVTETGSYDTIQVQNVNANGTYLFDNAILDDYLINGFADTAVVAYKKALPTYFERTIFWEEADTMKLYNDTIVVIASEFKPDPPIAGNGEIFGTFYENFPDGKTKAKARVKSASVTVRRVQNNGRGKEEDLELVAQTFTNDEGEFLFTKLDEAEYRLNIQLPGYPMDETSFVTIPIVDNFFDRQVGVNAEVVDGAIVVTKLVITGWEDEGHSFSVFPNPTVDYLFISGKQNDKSIDFRLVDSTGKKLPVSISYDEANLRWSLNLAGLQKGTYFLQVNKSGKKEIARIIIQ